jgi:UDP-N-acetylglucosamine 2-epimerase (non-hydrolysing)
VTERPETLEAGSNILAGVRGQDVLRATQIALSLEANWEPPVGYLDADVSSKVVKIVLRGRSVG